MGCVSPARHALLLYVWHTNRCHWLLFCSGVDDIDKKQIVGVIYEVKRRFLYEDNVRLSVYLRPSISE